MLSCAGGGARSPFLPQADRLVLSASATIRGSAKRRKRVGVCVELVISKSSYSFAKVSWYQGQLAPRFALAYLAKRSRHAFTEARTLSGLVPPKLVRDATELSTPSTE